MSASLICGLERGVELALLADRIEDRPAPVFELAQIGEARLQRAQLRVVERAGRLLPVAGDERHGRTFVQKPDRGGDLSGLDVQLLGDAFGDGFHGSRISSVGRAPLLGAPAPPGQRKAEIPAAGEDQRTAAAILARPRLRTRDVAAAKSPFMASARSSTSFHDRMAIATDTSADDAIIAPSDMSGKR